MSVRVSLPLPRQAVLIFIEPRFAVDPCAAEHPADGFLFFGGDEADAFTALVEIAGARKASHHLQAYGACLSQRQVFEELRHAFGIAKGLVVAIARATVRRGKPLHKDGIYGFYHFVRLFRAVGDDLCRNGSQTGVGLGADAFAGEAVGVVLGYILQVYHVFEAY